jgi:hypothetical protein
MSTAPIESRPILMGLAAAALAVLAASAFAPGLDGAFIFDSVERVLRNKSLAMTALDGEQLLAAAYAAQADYPQRGLAYVTLALNHYFGGQQFDPFVFKLTNLAVHILNGILVLVLAGLILSRWQRLGVLGPTSSARLVLLSALAAGLWLLHPIQITSVLYVVQRMTSLAGTWVLAGAILFILARQRLEEGRRGALAAMYGAVVVCAGIGFLCKQTALLLPAYAAVLELFLFRRTLLSTPQKRALGAFFAIVLVLPLAAGLVALSLAPEAFLGGYQNRDFTLVERLLTEARVLFFYLGLLLAPGLRRFGLYHDDLATSTGLLGPWTTLLAVIAWALILALTLWGARRRAPWAFAAAWFLVGHGMESTLLPLELVYEHRNYVPAVGLWIAVAVYVGVLWERAGRLRGLVAAAAGIWLLALVFMSSLRADAWRSPAILLDTLAGNHPNSYRSVVGYAFNSIPAGADLAVRFDAFRRAATLDDYVVVPLMEMSKMAAAVALYIGSDGQPYPPPGDGRPRPPVAAMALSKDADRVAGLLADLDAEIIHRLSEGPLRTDSVVALLGFVDCAFEGSRECATLEENVGRWHEAAISNERTPQNYRGVLGLSLAKYHAARGEYDEAVRQADRAGELAAGNLVYRLQQATLLAWLERWDALEILLDDIEKRFPRRAPADPTYRDLRQRNAEVVR